MTRIAGRMDNGHATMDQILAALVNQNAAIAALNAGLASVIGAQRNTDTKVDALVAAVARLDAHVAALDVPRKEFQGFASTP